MKNKIYIFTFSRSDYSSVRPIIKEVKKSSKQNFKLVVGGSHLSKKFGYTVKEIIHDKVKIDYKIDYLSQNQKFIDKNSNKIFQNLMKIFSNFLKRKNVKKIFIIGDRWELIPLVLSAYNLKIRIIHHSGGDYTFGSKDNFYRTITSVLSDVHLVGNKIHKKRLELLGIDTKKIFVVGEPSLLNFEKNNKKSKELIIATLYPSDYEVLNYNYQIKNFLKFLNSLDENVILTSPGSERGSEIFLRMIDKDSKKNIQFYKNLGSKKYNELMSKAKIMIGNSSSGILEASSYKLPVINIGNRQKGRLKTKNVIDCSFNIKDMNKSYEHVKSNKFLNKIKNITNPYRQNNCVSKILNILNKDYIINRNEINQLKDPLNLI